jgi:hypothetical protein
MENKPKHSIEIKQKILLGVVYRSFSDLIFSSSSGRVIRQSIALHTKRGFAVSPTRRRR